MKNTLSTAKGQRVCLYKNLISLVVPALKDIAC